MSSVASGAAVLPIHLRKLPDEGEPGSGELWVRPARLEDRGRRSTALLVHERGLDVLERGPGPVERLVVDAGGVQPTFDEMLAALLAQQLLAGLELPASFRGLAEYARLIRQGLIPTSLPVEQTLEGIYQAVRNRGGGELADPRAAEAFLARWQLLAARLRKAAETGEDVFNQSLFTAGADFAEEKAYLRRDEDAYRQDVARGERWKGRLPDGPPASSCLLLRTPKSLLFPFWSRRDRETPTGAPYLFLAVSWGDGEWVFSTDPVHKCSLKSLAELLQRAEVVRDPEGAAGNPWFDGRGTFQHTLVAAPKGGTKLSDKELLRSLKAWTAAPRRLQRVLLTLSVPLSVAACLILAWCFSRGEIPPDPDRGMDLLSLADPTEPLPVDARIGQDYALLFATNEYDNDKWGNLKNPVFDVTTVEKILKERYGFKTQLILNPKQEDIWSAIRSCFKQPYAEDGQLLLFFAGHGFFDSETRQGFIVARNSLPLLQDLARTTFIDHARLRAEIDNIPCKHILVMMDVCFGGTFDDSVARMRGEGEYEEVSKRLFIQRKMKRKTRKYLTSGGKTYVPDGRPGAHSPFAAKFIEALEHKAEGGILSLGQVHNHVEKIQPEPFAGRFGGDEVNSDFLFIEKAQ